MNKVFNYTKNAIRWYCKKASECDVTTPSGMIPYRYYKYSEMR